MWQSIFQHNDIPNNVDTTILLTIPEFSHASLDDDISKKLKHIYGLYVPRSEINLNQIRIKMKKVAWCSRLGRTLATPQRVTNIGCQKFARKGGKGETKMSFISERLQWRCLTRRADIFIFKGIYF